MLDIGRVNTLKIDHLDEDGAWLQAGQEQVLLPKKEVPAGARPGGRQRVFVYRDLAGHSVATARIPRAQLGDFALLKVSQVTKHGAFLDWGMEKELLVPYSEQPEKMRPGRSYLVKVCLDSTGRLVGTARIDRCLETEQIDLAEGQGVELTVWQFTDLGVKVIINGLYGGLLYRDEIRTALKRGECLQGYVRQIREDKRIDVTLRKVGAEGVEEAKAALLEILKEEDFLPLHDKSSAADIQQALGMSKKLFKKAVGGLYKDKLVTLSDEGVRLAK